MIKKATLRPKVIGKRSRSYKGQGRGFGSGAGRLSVYNPKHCKKVYRLRLLALSEKAIADVFEITQPTLKIWRDKYPEFADAWNRGGELADAHVVRSLYLRATGWSHQATKIVSNKNGIRKVHYTERYPPDPASMELWLTNRRRDEWKRRSSTELTGANDTPLLQPPAVIVLDFSGEDGPLIEGTDVYEKPIRSLSQE